MRVAVVDFDVHHGNGTEIIFRNEPGVLLCSSFQHPWYPYRDLAKRPPNTLYAPLPALDALAPPSSSSPQDSMPTAPTTWAS